MTENQSKCIHCERTSDEVPLLTLNYAGKEYFICSQHLPVLIHKPHELIDKLPGASNLTGHTH
jgi:hypothetical protein